MLRPGARIHDGPRAGAHRPLRAQSRTIPPFLWGGPGLEVASGSGGLSRRPVLLWPDAPRAPPSGGGTGRRADPRRAPHRPVPLWTEGGYDGRRASTGLQDAPGKRASRSWARRTTGSPIACTSRTLMGTRSSSTSMSSPRPGGRIPATSSRPRGPWTLNAPAAEAPAGSLFLVLDDVSLFPLLFLDLDLFEIVDGPHNGGDILATVRELLGEVAQVALVVGLHPLAALGRQSRGVGLLGPGHRSSSVRRFVGRFEPCRMAYFYLSLPEIGRGGRTSVSDNCPVPSTLESAPTP